MPLRFNKAERDEFLSRVADSGETETGRVTDKCSVCDNPVVNGKCTNGHCSTNGGDGKPSHESKTAHGGQCPMCGGPSTLLGQLGNRVHYRCRNCGADHSSDHPPEERGEFQDFEEDLGHHLLGPHEGALTLPGTEPVVEQQPQWGGAMDSPRVEPQTAPAGEQCAHCGTPLPYAGKGNRYCPNCHAEHDSYGRPLGAAPAAPAPGHPRAGEPLSQLDEPAARWGAKKADASLPPEAPPYQPKETALPYNPEAYESQVNDMHPAAQYAYQRAVQQGSDPQAAYQAAQEKQGEMGKRAQEGQNTQGVQIPVINTSYHGDRDGFVSATTIKRISHLL